MTVLPCAEGAAVAAVASVVGGNCSVPPAVWPSTAGAGVAASALVAVNPPRTVVACVDGRPQHRRFRPSKRSGLVRHCRIGRRQAPEDDVPLGRWRRVAPSASVTAGGLRAACRAPVDAAGAIVAALAFVATAPTCSLRYRRRGGRAVCVRGDSGDFPAGPGADGGGYRGCCGIRGARAADDRVALGRRRDERGRCVRDRRGAFVAADRLPDDARGWDRRGGCVRGDGGHRGTGGQRRGDRGPCGIRWDRRDARVALDGRGSGSRTRRP